MESILKKTGSYFTFLLLSLFSFSFLSCGVATLVSESTAHTAGWEENKQGVKVAKYWEYTQPQDLTDGRYNASAESVTVVDKNVYIAGYEVNSNGVKVAKYWKNGNPAMLTYGDNDAIAYSISVINNDVYVAGYEKNKNGNKVAKSWKNGTPTILSDGNSDTEAKCIVVVDNDVYIVGTEYPYGNPQYWKNGISFGLNGGTVANSIAVVDKDIHVVGYEMQGQHLAKAVYWKNNELRQELSFHSAGSLLAYGKFVTKVKDDIYVAGDMNGKAVFWKNGNHNFLKSKYNDSNTYANSISVVNDLEFIVGFEQRLAKDQRSVALLWLGKELPVKLTNGSTNAVANSVFVTKN